MHPNVNNKESMEKELKDVLSNFDCGSLTGDDAVKAIFSLFGVSHRRPVAWACKTCNKVDWADSQEQLAKPEHISYRGIDLGECKGDFIPLYDD